MMSILSIFERFTFAILPCSLSVARKVILAQASAWRHELDVDRGTVRDIRIIYNSPDGPTHPPLLTAGILLSEIQGREGPKTLFVSNVADGYSSMIYMISKQIPGLHLAIEASALSLDHPRNALTAIVAKKEVRVVYAMRDSNAWDFFETGEPLPFEDTSLYQARKKRDRLTPEIIARYLVQLGYASLDADFWISSEPAHLLCESQFRTGDATPRKG